MLHEGVKRPGIQQPAGRTAQSCIFSSSGNGGVSPNPGAKRSHNWHLQAAAAITRTFEEAGLSSHAIRPLEAEAPR